MYRLNSLNADIQLIVDGASANNAYNTLINNVLSCIFMCKN